MRKYASPKTRACGRPSKYLSEFPEQAYQLCLLGKTDAEMAEFFEVSESTLNLWKLKHSEFSESITRGKAQADAGVAFGLYQRAVGMTLPAVHVSNAGGKARLTEYTRHLPPDVAAAKFWLSNRQKAHWGSGPDVQGRQTSILNIVIHEHLKAVDWDPIAESCLILKQDE